MTLSNRIAALAALGQLVRNFSDEEKEQLYYKAAAHNSWFTRENVLLALDGISRYLDEEKLKQWLSRYDLPDENPAPKKVGVVMAGNIPLVGFHDFLSVLVTGHILYAKLSSQDPALLPFLANELCEIEPAFRKQINFADKLTGMDAMIATGSDNSSRYFEYYFSKLPHIIRKNRSSCAVLDGSESTDELFRLGLDITQYFGLGCRNVSKLFVPENYNFSPLLDALEPYNSLRNHHKYVNNYDYNKSIYLVNRVAHLDNGFLMLKEDQAFVSPISVVYYEHYSSKEELQEKLNSQAAKIQCVVGHEDGQINFGTAQEPELWDYADGVDTLEFLTQL
ncbi:acyl-CoA reductase [Nafulsella turpanensis]|uniref:acyl-CoA reductase n=1 Tax=Nafulsella turpanensis TaxID=1265690 RepID=UPI00034BDDA9|nr:acyl-CoA reductase [Nafulsella turpanensis]